MWYAFGIAVVLFGTSVNTAVDEWLHYQPRDTPWTLRARLTAAIRWAMWMSIVVYAWLIDSLREPYNEPVIWAFLFAGIAFAVVLFLLTHKSR